MIRTKKAGFDPAFFVPHHELRLALQPVGDGMA
jgi:hypothetical protein